MRAIVTIQTGVHAGRKLWLKAGQSLRFGRTESADFAVADDSRLSGVHFEIECGSQTVHLRDLNSANGTTVNGRSVTEVSLGDGDVIVAGSTTFRVGIEHSLRQSITSPSRSVVKPAESALPARLERESSGPENSAAPPLDVRRDRAEDESDAPTGGWQLVSSGLLQRRVIRPAQHLTVGRAESADFCVPDDLQMSGLHFGLSASSTSLRIEDLSSTNGTFVNGQRVTATTLADGDIVSAGTTQFVIHGPNSGRNSPATADSSLALGHSEPEIVGTVAGSSGFVGDSSSSAAVAPQEEATQPEPGSCDLESTPPDRPREVPIEREPVRGVESTLRGELEIVILDVCRGGEPVRKFWLTPGQQLVVGSAATCDEVVDDTVELASRHFVLRGDRADCVVQDLDTSTGTFLNGQKVAIATLKNGDVIRAGECTFQVQIVRVDQ